MKVRSSLLIVCVLSLPFFTGCGEEEESASLEGEQGVPPDSAPISTASEPGETTVPVPISTVSEPDATAVIPGEAAESEETDELAGELAALEANIAALEGKMLDKSQQARAKLTENLDSLKEERERLQEKAEELQAAGAGAMQALMKGFNDKLNGLERQIEPDEKAY